MVGARVCVGIGVGAGAVVGARVCLGVCARIG